MALSIKSVTIQPPKNVGDENWGWSSVFIHMNDAEMETSPNVAVEVSIPYTDEHTIGQTREAAFNRAKEMLRLALDFLEQTPLGKLPRE